MAESGVEKLFDIFSGTLQLLWIRSQAFRRRSRAETPARQANPRSSLYSEKPIITHSQNILILYKKTNQNQSIDTFTHISIYLVEREMRDERRGSEALERRRRRRRARGGERESSGGSSGGGKKTRGGEGSRSSHGSSGSARRGFEKWKV